MANLIRIRRSSTPATAPAASSLAHGELALNTADGKMYYGKVDGSIGILPTGTGDMLKSVYDTNNDGRIDPAALGTGTASATTFLRGDSTWATPAAGGSALDANSNLLLPAATGVTTPAAGAITERVITRAGFSHLAYANVDLPDLTVMPHLENYSLCKMEASASASMLTTGCTVFSSGTASGGYRTNTTYSNSRETLGYQTAATAGSSAYLMAQTASRIRGNAARRGGFYTVVRCQPVLLAGHQGFVGMTTLIAALSGEPSAENNASIGMICDSTDTNWQIFCKPTGSAGTKIDTGLAKTTAGVLLALHLYSPPNGAGIQYLLENEETQTTVASGTMSATLPTNVTTFLGLGGRVRNGATTTVAAINIYNAASSSRY